MHCPHTGADPSAQRRRLRIIDLSASRSAPIALMRRVQQDAHNESAGQRDKAWPCQRRARRTQEAALKTGTEVRARCTAPGGNDGAAHFFGGVPPGEQAVRPAQPWAVLAPAIDRRIDRWRKNAGRDPRHAKPKTIQRRTLVRAGPCRQERACGGHALHAHKTAIAQPRNSNVPTRILQRDAIPAQEWTGWRRGRVRSTE